MYRLVSDFLHDWSHESEATMKIFNTLTDETLEQRVTPGGRSIKQIAWHIAISLPEMMSKAGLTMGPFVEKAPPDLTAAIIKSSYEIDSKKVADEVKEKWNDKALAEEVNMYGQMWSRGTVLAVLVNHQIHHRAQLTVLMRQAGLSVPGIYGPAKEEWAQMGMPPQE